MLQIIKLNIIKNNDPNSKILEEIKIEFIQKWFKIMIELNGLKIYQVIMKEPKYDLFLKNKEFISLLISFYKNQNLIQNIYKHFNDVNEKRLEKIENINKVKYYKIYFN